MASKIQKCINLLATMDILEVECIKQMSESHASALAGREDKKNMLFRLPQELRDEIYSLIGIIESQRDTEYLKPPLWHPLQLVSQQVRAEYLECMSTQILKLPPSAIRHIIIEGPDPGCCNFKSRGIQCFDQTAEEARAHAPNYPRHPNVCRGYLQLKKLLPMIPDVECHADRHRCSWWTEDGLCWAQILKRMNCAELAFDRTMLLDSGTDYCEKDLDFMENISWRPNMIQSSISKEVINTDILAPRQSIQRLHEC
ncbi:hypothetical protein CKM354_001069900 [Cercospora kikuchii]|uniref:Uncharacterized protein n=1 Tax=Cercospora kikuchii TaxID=84275 RepID=A0A9P3FHJ4_9PEZI|nr:uncharacterized protein CKM354_001069900 [Cercospora kikuchii]GIZ47611.1 hypothetical protein CKM354_001069900 [Cercospora kikuchii]